MIWVHHTSPDYASAVRYVSERIWGKFRDLPSGTALVVPVNGKIAGVVVFNGYQPDDGVIELSAAADSPRWLSRPVLWAMFSYVFDELKCQLAVLRVDPSNNRLRRILSAYGFTETRVPRLRGRDTDESIYTLGDDVWRDNGFHKEHSHG